MASGIACLDSDGYQNTETCIYQYEEAIGIVEQINPPKTMLENLQSMRSHLPAGEKNEYVSANTFVAGMVIEKITAQPLWLALQDLIWNNIGSEADALLMISPEGTAASHGGISARLRDIARFGEIFTSEGLGILDNNHLMDLRSDKGIAFSAEGLERLNNRFDNDAPTHAAWQWDMIWPDGAMFKAGYSGQGLFVDPDRSVIMVWFGTHSIDGEEHQLLPMARRITQTLFQ